MNFELETASLPSENLRRVAIDPVSRVEGHGKVTILLDEDNKVHQVRLHIVEFRGFERFIQGRPYWEVPVMVQRLCGICPVSHHLAASKALDLIVGASKVTPTADKMRRLMHYGQILQSHALHFFHLSSPDLLFGFGSSLGFTLALVLFAGIRERLDGADVPLAFKGTAIAMITAGFMSLAFMGFAGLDRFQ
ncbi:MAG: nickel-dependent hydrogenase large subunit [Thauera sp.]|nr:nickel-dependent hydrogenase large subunit [Thauera sp.]